MSKILKGKISTIESQPVDSNELATTAKVISLIGGSVTMPLIIPWYLRGDMGKLQPGTEVVYVEFEDKTGYILGRFDGDFQGTVPYDITVDGSITATDDVNAPDFVSDSCGSYNEHKHTDSQSGTTSEPLPSS